MTYTKRSKRTRRRVRKDRAPRAPSSEERLAYERALRGEAGPRAHSRAAMARGKLRREWAAAWGR